MGLMHMGSAWSKDSHEQANVARLRFLNEHDKNITKYIDVKHAN
jgi:hypothetical protein